MGASWVARATAAASASATALKGDKRMVKTSYHSDSKTTPVLSKRDYMPLGIFVVIRCPRPKQRRPRPFNVKLTSRLLWDRNAFAIDFFEDSVPAASQQRVAHLFAQLHRVFAVS